MSTAEDTGTPFRGKIVQLPDAKGTGVGIDRGRAAFADLSPLISEAHTSDLELSQWRKLFEQIVAREAGTFELELGVPRFLAALGAGPVQKQQLGEIFEFLGGYQPGSRRANEDAQRTITQLHSARSFLRWYTTRLSVRDAYVSCMEGTGRKMPAPLKLEDALFSLRFEHDATLSGVAGMYVSTSQCWVGHFGEALWTEVTLSTKDGPVEVSPGWEAWSHLDPCSTPFPRKASRTFVSLMPFRPDSQSLFIDNLRLFVPYSALHLSPGKHDITVFARVMNSRGEELACSSEVTSLSSSVLRSRDRVLVASPQQLGYWKEDPVTRTGFLSTRVTRCTHSLGHSPLDTLRVRTEVRVSADSLCSLFLECRLLDDEGAPLLSALPEFADEQGMVYTSCELAPSSTSSVFSPLDLELPLCAVAQRDLPYESKKPFFVELVVRTDQGQIVCGVQEQVPAHYLSGVPVRTSLEGWQKTRDILCSESMHQIADILIDPLFPFGSTKAFRVSCHIDTPVGSDVPYRLRIDVRREREKRSVSRLLYFLPVAESSLTLVGCFGIDEVMSLYSSSSKTERNKDEKCVVSASLLDPQGLPLHIVEQLVPFPSYASPVAPMPKPQSPAYISDMVTSGGLLGGDVQATFRLDLDCSASLEETITLYTEIVSSTGASELGNPKTMLPGTISQISFAKALEFFPRMTGWVQHEIQCAPELSSQDLDGKPVLKVMLFARDGRLLQVLRQPLAAEHWDFPYEGVLSGNPHEQKQAITSRISQSRFWPKLKDFLPKA